MSARLPTRVLDPDGLRDVLARLVAGVRELLAANYVGAYLQGSLATGGFDNGSDVDFLIVLEREVPTEVAKRLESFHRALYDHPSHWAQHLEGSYAPRATLANLPPPRRKLLYLDHGSTAFERSDHDHYLAVLWTLRERGIVLDGPDPKTLVPSIPPDALRDEVRTTLVNWTEKIIGDTAELSAWWYQAFTVLSYCRMAQSIRTGEVHSKSEGATYAKTVMDPKWHGLIERAQRQRLRPAPELALPADQEALDETRSFIRYVVKFHA